ncbi:MAG: RNA polymerase sigma factor [Ruminococcus sp.]|nr:RNA polymerase sigma factor [Ruminococcus sp.]
MNSDFTSLVSRAKKGDADAFAALYAEIYKDLYKIAYLNLNNADDAADAVSDAVSDAFAGMKSLRGPESFKAWFISILSSKIKKRQREYIRTRQMFSENDITETASDNSSETKTGFQFDTAEVKEAFGKISEDERLILSLSAVSGYKSEEIAKTLGISANTVRSKAARAKEKMRRLLT